MKLSTRGRYALRLMLDLALQPEGETIPLKNIAQRQGISLKYLEQIVMTLVCSGYLQAIRGAQGGYRLAQKPENYTVGMILRTIEGSLSPVTCLEDTNPPCQRKEYCVTLEVYRRIDEAIDTVIDSITLKDLVTMQYEKWGGTEPPKES